MIAASANSMHCRQDEMTMIAFKVDLPRGRMKQTWQGQSRIERRKAPRRSQSKLLAMYGEHCTRLLVSPSAVFAQKPARKLLIVLWRIATTGSVPVTSSCVA
jgi:hypothetical protein